jgi:hypothetical protein
MEAVAEDTEAGLGAVVVVAGYAVAVDREAPASVVLGQLVWMDLLGFHTSVAAAGFGVALRLGC